MLVYKIPVRMNTPQTLNYTFKNQSDAIIDLTDFVSVSLEVKLAGEVYDTVVAAFVSKPVGTVKLTSYTFDEPGIWMAQFFCTDGSGNTLFGEPVWFTVVKNVEDAALAEVLLR